jgi:hypothetical protein
MNKDYILNHMTLSEPLEIIDPKRGFNGYLLRCKAIDEEKGEASIVIFEPGNENPICQPLSNDINERLKMRKDWWHKTPKGYYACINYEMDENVDGSTFRSHFPTDVNSLIELTKEVVEFCTTDLLPSYEPFAVVWHTYQLVRFDNGNLGVRPIHCHLLMKSFKRRTSQEMKIILTSYTR